VVNLVSPMSWGLKDCLLMVNSRDHADKIGYGDMVNLLEEYSNIKTKELKDYIFEKLKNK